MNDFVREDLDTFSLTPAASPPSVKIGIVRIPAPTPDFDDLYLGATVHRCEAPLYGVCGICDDPEGHVPVHIVPGDRFRLVNSHSRVSFSLGTDCEQDVVWTVTPATGGAPYLYSSATGGSSSRTLRASGTVWARAGSAPGVYTIRATHPGCSQSTDTATFTVGKVQLEAIRFNWDHGAATNDAINLRGDFATEFDVTVGEWIRGGQNLPACYVTNVSPVLEARFTIHPDTLASCTIHATDGPFGGIVSTNVAFSGGNSGPVRLAASGGIGRFVDKCSYDLDWMATELEGDAFPAEGFVKTRNHVLYTIFHEPLAPWKSVPHGDSQNAWTSALDFALVTAGAGNLAGETNALAAITQYLFSGHGLQYDTAQGRPTYLTNSIFRLSAYLEKSGDGSTNRLANTINCVDQAAAVSTLGSLLGIDNNIQLLEPFGYLNVVDLVGIGPCNNPIFTGKGSTRTNAVEGIDDKHRSSFVRHFYVQSHSVIFDACAGPALGTTNNVGYLASVVDKSTTDEQRPPRYGRIECGLDSRTLNIGRFGQIE